MKCKLHYGDGVISLPAAIENFLPRADGDAVKILILLAAGGNPSREKLAESAGCTLAEVDQALAFWRGAGIIDTDVTDRKRSAANTVEKKPTTAQAPVIRIESSSAEIETGKTPLGAATLPHYTTEELTALLESRRELGALMHECGNVLGKILNTHEINTLLSLIDYLNLDSEYLLLLLAHCVKIGKKSLRYVENYAFSLYDQGVTDIKALEERLKQHEQLEEAETKIRTLFGMKSRALTSKEQKMIQTWLFTYRYDMDVITRAYEMTVNAIGNASVPYTNSILERWAASGYHTMQEIDAGEATRAAGQSKTVPGNSFDTNDFFDAALRRSFGNDYQPASKGQKKS